MGERKNGAATLSLQNISMYYHGGNTVVPGIVDVTLEMHKGEFVVITGESGSGKTTLLNIISALLPYHDGELYVNGEPTSAFGEEEWEEYRRKHIGFVFQDYNLIPSYTVLENVMSAVLLCGREKKEARELAKTYLNKVGLGGYLHRKALKLSSGQKQRLAIARALAKETDIIVADEPTGNLDSENGRQIVELLAELSKEKLVIMVSHNVEEAMEFATRRVRIHNSRMVADQILRENCVSEKKELQETKSSDKKIATQLAVLNGKAQPVKVFFVLLFMIFCTLAAGIFASVYRSSSDDAKMRTYQAVFVNGDDKRIVVARQDGAAMTREDVAALQKIPHVEQVELYDYVADVNYYSVPEKDYRFNYSYVFYEGAWEEGVERPKREMVQIESINEKKFMRSVTCVGESELLAGRMPENANEILCGGDASLLGTTIEVVIKDTSGWNREAAVLSCTVTGVLKEDDGQIYFSEELCKVLLANGGRYYGRLTVAGVHGMSMEEAQERDYVYYVKGSYAVLFPDYSLSGDSYCISAALFPVLPQGPGLPDADLKTTFVVNKRVKEAHKDTTVWMEYCVGGGTLEEKFSKSSAHIVSMAPELYYSYMPEEVESRQITLYIEDYAYADDVLAAVNAEEYRGASPLRVGALEYDSAKVTERTVTLMICMAAFVLVYVLELFILKMFLKLKRGDYQVLRSIGMSQKQMRGMLTKEFVFYAVCAVAIAAVAVTGAWLLKTDFLYDILKYLRWYHYGAVALLQILTGYLLALSYNGYLKKQFGKSR